MTARDYKLCEEETDRFGELMQKIAEAVADFAVINGVNIDSQTLEKYFQEGVEVGEVLKKIATIRLEDKFRKNGYNKKKMQTEKGSVKELCGAFRNRKKEVGYYDNFVFFNGVFNNADDLKANLVDDLVLSHFDELPDAFNGGYTGYLFHKRKNIQIGFIKVSEEFLENKKRDYVQFYIAHNKEILDYWNDGKPVKPLEARDTNKALVLKGEL